MCRAARTSAWAAAVRRTGLLSLGLSNPDSAATATVNVLDTLLAAAQIAQYNPNGNSPVINLTGGLTGVAGISLQVISPPVVAIGEGGATPPIQASTAAVNLTVTLLPVGLPALDLVIAQVSAFSTPMVVSLQVAAGTATLNSVDCESTKAATTATIKVTPSITSVCLAVECVLQRFSQSGQHQGARYQCRHPRVGQHRLAEAVARLVRRCSSMVRRAASTRPRRVNSNAAWQRRR